jgi:acetyl esterase/lipase
MKRILAAGVGVLALTLLLFCSTPTPAQKKQPAFTLPEDIEWIKDVEYGRGGDRALKMHILRPKKAPREPMPVLVWIHGGGWSGGSKEGGVPKLAPYAQGGYLCATIEYRLSGEAIFPAQIEDCKCAIRFLRAKAKQFNLDPDRIGVWGSSAGGHLVALLGTSAYVKEFEGKGGHPEYSSRVQAVCDFCGPTDLIRLAGDSSGANSPITKLLGGVPKEKQELATKANPITHVTKDAAPTLIVHGDEDKLVVLSQSELLHDALKKASVPVTLHIAKGQGHGISGDEVNRTVREFFDRTLRVEKNGKNSSSK